MRDIDVALHADSLNLISLCSGGGGLDLGFELAFPDARSVVLVEGEAFGAATLVQAMEARLMAPAPVWSDVRTFDGRPWRGLVDGLIGGIPCQPHSLAGRRKGADDERDLWSPTRRIIVQARPWFVGIENVRGFVSSGGLERVWRDLRRLGYAVEAGLFTAAEVGASHERERCFVLAVADGGCTTFCGRRKPRHISGETRESQSIKDQWQRHGNAVSDGRTDVGHPDSAGLEGRRSGPDERTGERIARKDGRELVNADGPRSHAASLAGIHRGEEGARTRHGEPERSGGQLADANLLELRREPSAGQQQELQRDDAASRSSIPAMGNSSGVRKQRNVRDQEEAERAASCDQHIDKSHEGSGWPDSFDAGRNLGLYPPRPSDLDSWRRVLAHSPHLEPAVRRMADGVAARLDLSGPHAARIERLRMLGNGVVPLEAAYAISTLVSRLAARGIPGAAELVRLMTLTSCSDSQPKDHVGQPGASTVRVTTTWHNAGPHTIWAKLAERLGREPTNAEAAAEVKRILLETESGKS